MKRKLRAEWSPLTVALFCSWCHSAMRDITAGQVHNIGKASIACPNCRGLNTLPPDLLARSRNGQPEIDPDNPPGRAEAWERVIGNLPLRRAMEIAIAGHHTLAYIGPPEYAWAAVEMVLGEWASIMQRCPCGENLRYTGAMCSCKTDDIDAFRKTRRFQEALNSDLIVEALPSTDEDFWDTPEPYSEALARIEKVRMSQAFGAKALPKPDWASYRHIGDAASFKLLKAAKDRWELTSERLLSVQRVAHTIALLEGVKLIEARHMAEALSFRTPLQDP